MASPADDPQAPLASQPPPADYAATGESAPAGQRLLGGVAGAALPAGSLALLLLATGNVAASGLANQVMPELAANYYNGWQGDPCAGAVVGLTCQEASARWTRSSSAVGLVASLLFVVGSPICGALSDAIGRKPVLVANIAMWSMCCVMLAALYARSISINLYFASYVLGAMVPGPLIFDLWIADRTSPTNRVFVLSLLAVVVDGDGLVVPLIGSMLSQFGTITGALAVYALLVVPAVLWLPESLSHAKRRLRWNCDGAEVCAAAAAPVALLNDRANRLLVFLCVSMGLLGAFQNANLQVYLRQVHGMSRQGFLRIATFASAATLLSQLFLADPLSRRLGFRGVIATACALNMTVCALMVLAPSSIGVVWLGCFLGALSSVAGPVVTATLFGVVPEAQRGKVLGEFRALSTVGAALASYGLSVLFAVSASGGLVPGHSLPALAYAPIGLLNAAALAFLLLAWPDVERAQAAAAAASEKALVAGDAQDKAGKFPLAV